MRWLDGIGLHPYRTPTGRRRGRTTPPKMRLQGMVGAQCVAGSFPSSCIRQTLTGVTRHQGKAQGVPAHDLKLSQRSGQPNSGSSTW